MIFSKCPFIVIVRMDFTILFGMPQGWFETLTYKIIRVLCVVKRRHKKLRLLFVKKKHLTPPFFCSKLPLVARNMPVYRQKGRTVMEKIVEQGLLYDFYGELLTEHQRSVYEDAVNNDMSLAEMAEQYGISRQGVHDLIRRCDKLLAGYEEKLHLVKKFAEAKRAIAKIEALAEEGKELPERECRERLGEIRGLTAKLMESF